MFTGVKYQAIEKEANDDLIFFNICIVLTLLGIHLPQHSGNFLINLTANTPTYSQYLDNCHLNEMCCEVRRVPGAIKRTMLLKNMMETCQRCTLFNYVSLKIL